MQTRTDEIAGGTWRFSTFVPGVTPDGFTFDQCLVEAAQPLLFHTGPRAMFPLVSQAVSKIIPLADLCDRPPRADGELLGLGGRRVLFEETTRTLLCGDLFTRTGNGPAMTGKDIAGPAKACCAVPEHAAAPIQFSLGISPE